MITAVTYATHNIISKTPNDPTQNNIITRHHNTLPPQLQKHQRNITTPHTHHTTHTTMPHQHMVLSI